MSRQDDGYGRKPGPNAGSQSEFTNKQSLGHAPDVQTGAITRSMLSRAR
jgi:hypothetical protein